MRGLYPFLLLLLASLVASSASYSDVITNTIWNSGGDNIQLSITSSASCSNVITNTIWNGGGDNNQLSEVYKELLACPETRALHLKIIQGGCIMRDDPENLPFSEGDRLPPLEELHLNGYDFDNFRYIVPRRWDDGDSLWNRALRYVADYTGLDSKWPASIRQVRFTGENIDSWKQAMDWNHIKDLELVNTNHASVQRMKGELSALKSLKLGPSFWDAEENLNVTNYTTAFLLESPPLTNLSLHGYTDLLDWNAILERHGPTLNSFELRQWESEEPLYPRPTLSLPQLRHVSEACPQLKELSIDINRNGTWPHEILDSLATFESVTTLQLWFELGMDQHQLYDKWEDGQSDHVGGFRQPLVSSSSALGLFNRLRGLKKGMELQRVRFNVGDVGRDYGHMLRIPSWGEDLAEWYDCNVLDSDGQRKIEGAAWCERGVPDSFW